MSNVSRQYVKPCEIEDFDDPELLKYLRSVQPGLTPDEERHRKNWEFAMLASYLSEVGALNDDASALAVAAGHEAPLYWLSNRIRKVVATDIYGDGGFASREATATMLNQPEAFAPYPYRERHLEVRHVNALNLEFPDASFDIVYSLSSIEHFGGPKEIRKAAREMSRVLKPGGHLVIVTECLIEPRFIDRPAVQFAVRCISLNTRAKGATPARRTIDSLTPAEIQRDIVQQVEGWLVQPLQTHVSARSFDNLITWRGAGELTARTGNPYPHILLKGPGAPWTSVFLAFAKPDRNRR